MMFGSFKRVEREEREALKKWLRQKIAEKDHFALLHFCVAEHPEFKRSMENLFIYGYSESITTKARASWVFRYYLRLIGQRV